jgi:hypothetical protein
MDLGFALDVEFLCGAGLDKTKRFLAEQQTPEAAEALSYICRCESQFADFTPQKHLERYRYYFKVA